MEKDSPSLETTNFSFFCRSAHFGNVSPFLVGATNTFSELIHPLVKLPNNKTTKQQNNSRARTFYNLSEALGSFSFLPLRGAGTGFVVVLPLPLIFDPPLYILHFTIYTTFHREATLKTALELLDYSVNNNTPVYQIHKEGGVANRFLTARRHF